MKWAQAVLKGPSKDPTLDFAPSEILWREYTRQRKVGAGNCGEVWEVENVESGDLAACKVLPKSVNSRYKVAREAAALASVGEHENVVSLFGAFEDDDNFYLLLELATEGCLLKYINDRRGLCEEEARHIFRQVVAAVHQCHKSNIVHRDIKPDNILLSFEAPGLHGSADLASSARSSCSSFSSSFSSSTSSTAGYNVVAKLADFGLAVPLKPGRKLRHYAGSFPYEAPEVNADEPCYNHTADVWSLGVLLYVMLFSRMPPADLPINGLPPPARLPASANNVSPEAVQLLHSILQVNPRQRASTEKILSSAWLAREGGESPPSSPEGGSIQCKERRRRWGLRLL